MASQKGKQIQNKIESVQDQVDPGVVTHNRNDKTDGAYVAPPSQLPRKYRPADKEWDNAVELKRQLMEQNDSPDTKYGTIMFTDRDARALLKKKEAVEAAKFDGWFGERFNTGDLSTRILGEQLNPEYYQAREEALVEKADLALRIELMKLYGPRSEEDLMIIYGLQTGYLKLDKDWNVIGEAAADDVESRANNHRKRQELLGVSRFFKNQSTVRRDLDEEASYANARNTPFVNGGRRLPPSVFANDFEQSVAAGAGRGGGLGAFFDFLRRND